MKKAYCLYRVSTKKQVDKQKDDIPMQKIACTEFAEQQGWVIAKEFYEKGVSGFKVSAKNRDAIQDLKEAALNKEFDILLVFMFDRLGRIDDETPFIVEWFAKQGIEIWSVKEGEQKFESHTDKLLNYIRYWQANGESVKTSMRLKTRMAQLTAEGIYRGGATPFGYKAEYLGRLNKKGQAVRDLVIDENEAKYVKLCFEKTLKEGYGSFRLAKLINKLGVRTRNGKEFQSVSINRILRNKLYCGYYIAGETVSPKLENLVIIDEKDFNGVQYILDQRANKQVTKQHMAMTTKGKCLLSGNLVCAHCGTKLISSTQVDRYTRKDGTVAEKEYIKYICYHRSRKLNDCDGQQVYAAHVIDDIVLSAVNKYLEAIKQTPKDRALEIRYKKELAEIRKQKKELLEEKARLDNRLTQLSAEVGKCICGENRFPIDVLSMSIDTTKAEIDKTENLIAECDAELNKQGHTLENLDYYYNQFLTWANEFEYATREQQKMIICQLITEIKVGKGYIVDIEFNASYKQFIIDNKVENKMVV